MTARRTVVLAAAGVSLIAVCYGLARFAYGLFLPSFRAAFDLDAATAGLIASSSYVAYCAGILFATAATPRLGARLVAVAAGVLASAGTGIIAVAGDPGILALGVAVAGSSTGVASPPLAHAVARRVDTPRRDRVQTLVNSGTGLGVLVSGPVALLVDDRWRLAWAAFAVICLAVTVWTAIVVPSARDDRRRDRARSSRLPRGAARLLVAAAVLGIATAAVWTFGQELLRDAGGQDAGQAAWAWIALGACGLLGAAAGDLVARMGLGASWRALLVASAAATATLALATGSVAATLIASGVFGAVYIALTGILLVWSTRVFSERPSSGVGLVFLALALGQAVGSPVLGAIADASDLRIAFVAAAVITVAGLLATPRRDGRSGGARPSG